VKIDGGLGYLGDEVGAAPTSERAAGGPVLLVWTRWINLTSMRGAIRRMRRHGVICLP